jgi:hypothetical protein
MSRAHENFFIERLARLDRLIAESEALASRCGDEETLLRISEDIARWRETRDGCEYALRRTKSVNRFVSGALITFCTSFVTLGLVAVFQPSGPILIAAVIPALLLLFGSAAAYVIALVVRDFAAHGRRAWHFSLRSLLAVTTVIAILLGMLAYALRN